MPHSTIAPAIHYWGTPVVLVTTSNPDGTTNISPMSSAWWLGQSCVLGLNTESKTTENLLRTGECVLNLPDDTMVTSVDALACTTGTDPVTEGKKARRYVFVKDKFARAGVTPIASEMVRPDRIAECPVQMECRVLQHMGLRPDLGAGEGAGPGWALVIEVRVLRTYVDDAIRMPGFANRVDPDKWRPLVHSFQEFYGLRAGKVGVSELGKIPEELYRGL